MRQWLFGVVCGAFLFGALPLLAEDVLRITPGGSDPLSERVLRLEQAVSQLQNQSYGAAVVAAKPTATVSGVGVTCAIETPFDGVFTANAPTEAEARKLTIDKCKERMKGGLYCINKEVKCAS